MISASLTYENVITDYCRAHDLKLNIEAVVDAVLVAVDTGNHFACVFKSMDDHVLCEYKYS